MTDIFDSVETLMQRLQVLRRQLPSQHRLIVGIAGAPGSGKSTLAAEICQRLNEGAAQSIVVPMDGFHLDNAILRQRDQIAVKGSPQTFDVDGLANLVRRLAQPSPAPVYIPVFDRNMDLSRNAAHCVEAQHGIVIVEGNYLLLARPGWQQLAALFDLKVMLEVPMETLQERLIQRWLDHGHDPELARSRALSNDIPNAQVVVRESSGAHLILKSMRQ